MIYPLNRYLVVVPIDNEEESSSTVLIPEGVSIKASAFCLVELVEPNASSSLRKGMKLVAQSHLLERAEIAGNTYYLLLENHVVGFLGNHEED
jgi:hypothetical protein